MISFRASARIFFAIAFIPCLAFSASIQQKKTIHIQPDGSKVEVLVSGDEYHHIAESPEGYTLVKDPKSGWLSYAKVSSDKKSYLSTGEKYRGKGFLPITRLQKRLRISEQSSNELHEKNWRKLHSRRFDTEPDIIRAPQPLRKSAADPLKITGLTILVKFPDVPVPAMRTKQHLDDMLNKVGYDDGSFISVRDYFFTASNGKLIYNNIVAGFLDSDKSYKELDGAPWDSGPVEAWVIRLLNKLESTGFDFTQLTQNTPAGGTVALNIWYAADWGSDGLWPYQSSMRWTSKSGVSFRRFQISPMGTSTSYTTNSVFIHENGHLLFGWGDLYKNKVNHECVMGNSATRPGPALPNPYFRMKEGWVTPVNITGDEAGTSYTLAVNDKSSFRFDNTSNPAKEFYLFNGLQASGFYKVLGTSGMHIWTVDPTKDRSLQVGVRVLNVKQNSNNWTFGPPLSAWPSGSPAPAPELTDITQSNTHLTFRKKGTLIETLPGILSHPANAAVILGKTATFNVTATGGKLQYQWQKNGSNISGATGPSYTTPAIDSTYLQFTYRCVVKNSLGTAISNGATITISKGPAISLDKGSYTAGETLVASHSGFANTGTDWVGIYRNGATDLSAYLKYEYISGESGKSEFTLNHPAGQYFAVGFENDSYTEASPRVPFSIVSPATTLSDAALSHISIAISPNSHPRTLQVKYQLNRSSHVKAEVYDIRGNLVRTLIDGRQDSGGHSLQANGAALTGGLYIIKFRVDNKPAASKIYSML